MRLATRNADGYSQILGKLGATFHSFLRLMQIQAQVLTWTPPMVSGAGCVASLTAIVAWREMGIKIGFLGRRNEITYVSICHYAWHIASAQKKRLFLFLITCSTAVSGHVTEESRIPPG